MHDSNTVIKVQTKHFCLEILFGYFPVELFAEFVHLRQSFHQPPFLLELEVFPVEAERSDRVLYRVMGHTLDILLQEVPRQKLRDRSNITKCPWSGAI